MANRDEIEHGIARGIILGSLVALALVVMGCTPLVSQGKPTEPPISPIPRPATVISAITPDAQPQLQRLRITNQSAVTLGDLVVIFPNERIDFGDIPAGATTGYKVFSYGVYRYAAYNIELDGQIYEQPVMDWIGETPMQGEDFTYILEADAAQWKTGGFVIRLVEVIEINHK